MTDLTALTIAEIRHGLGQRAFSAVELTRAYLEANGRGMAAVEQTIQYKRELMAGDTVAIVSAPIEIKDKALRFTHEMRNTQSGEVAAATTLTAVFLDTAARKAASFPAEVRERVLKMPT